ALLEPDRALQLRRVHHPRSRARVARARVASPAHARTPPASRHHRLRRRRGRLVPARLEEPDQPVRARRLDAVAAAVDARAAVSSALALGRDGNGGTGPPRGARTPGGRGTCRPDGTFRRARPRGRGHAALFSRARGQSVTESAAHGSRAPRVRRTGAYPYGPRGRLSPVPGHRPAVLADPL